MSTDSSNTPEEAGDEFKTPWLIWLPVVALLAWGLWHYLQS